MELMGEEVKELLPYILPILAAQNQRKMLPIYIKKNHSEIEEEWHSTTSQLQGR